MPDEHEDAPLLWTVPVLDAFNRKRVFSVDVSNGRVVLLPPPGEGCTLSPDEVPTLIESLSAARDVADAIEPGVPTTTGPGAGSGAGHEPRGAGDDMAAPSPTVTTTPTAPPRDADTATKRSQA